MLRHRCSLFFWFFKVNFRFWILIPIFGSCGKCVMKKRKHPILFANFFNFCYYSGKNYKMDINTFFFSLLSLSYMYACIRSIYFTRYKSSVFEFWVEISKSSDMWFHDLFKIWFFFFFFLWKIDNISHIVLENLKLKS